MRSLAIYYVYSSCNCDYDVVKLLNTKLMRVFRQREIVEGGGFYDLLVVALGHHLYSSNRGLSVTNYGISDSLFV